jgi:hypothetical protein
MPSKAYSRYAAELKILGASMHRAQGRLSEAKIEMIEAEALLEALSNEVIEGDSQLRFRLNSEKALNAFFEGAYEQALDLFLLAEVQARNSCDRASALMNLLLCYENLGLPFDSTLERLNELRAARDFPAAVLSQLRAFEMREAFRRGEIKKALSLEKKRVPSSYFDQARYYSIFLRALPYHTSFEAPSAELVAELAVSNSFHQRSFRFRTLQVVLHPDDLSSLKASEVVDRVYLWTWAWLCEPRDFPLQRIVLQLQKNSLFERAHALTLEDRALLRNALLWLRLFDRSGGSELEPLLAVLRLPHSLREMLLPDMELLVIRLFEALLEGQAMLAKDYFKVLKAHPLWNSSEILWRELVLAVENQAELALDHPLAFLAAQLGTLLSNRREDLAREDFVVDLERGEVRAGSELVRSSSMAQGLAALIDKGSVPCDDFARLCWGLTRYDPLLHAPKIFNLLSRMRKLGAAPLRFGVKSGFVFCQGDKTAFRVLRPGPHAQAIAQERNWPELLDSRPLSKAFDKAQFNDRQSHDQQSSDQHWPERVCRKDLEERLGKSRATAGRMLVRWEKEGLLKREGSTRDARYRLSSKLRARLSSEEVLL